MTTLEERLAAEQRDQLPSRFQRLLTPGNFLDDILALKKTTVGTDRRLATPGRKLPREVVGHVAQDHQYEAELHFARGAGDGAEFVSWTEPLVEPEPGVLYYVRLRIAQHMVAPLLQGFDTVWTKPAGWTWLDGHGTTLHDEAVSNPLSIVRVARAPTGTVPRAGFRVEIAERYQP